MKKRIRGASGLLLALVVAAGAAPAVSQAFELNGFGDVTFTNAEASNSGESNNGFALGQLDFYVAEQIGDRIDVLTEFVVESPGEGFVVDLERLQIGYAFNNSNKVRAGRFHNLIGYWNTAYHHGAQLQTTIGRPFFLEFEDENGVLPVHMVGLWYDGHFETSAGRVGVGVMFGNGASITGDGSGPPVELNPDSAGDADNDKAVSARISFNPSSVRGLGVGVSGQMGKVNIVGVGGGVPNDQIDQTIWAVDLEYLAHNAELLAEYYAWSNDSQTNGMTEDSSAYYVQLGYTLAEQVTPYARYESLDATSEPYFDAVGMTPVGTDRTKAIATVGVRYDLNYRSALKAEWRAIDDSDVDGSYNELGVQWSFSF
jgi:hypothetical protein